ncbi:GNAT family N-acetyltransferase [Paenibacillus nanensis]|uniref:GNAT family N-acetyltransferase n=1 Tax=Paenibacillus nanensis TaxID=393251 RepID=A0A3A1V8C8_9BACL|nr:GNAT family N-acetyltransferase [Paenibacillus nanensis]RIX53690.1 GNAT family N-acetyltransferase [Paenibacillus nanensis]
MEIRSAKQDEIVVVRDIILESFKEYAGLLHPPSGALSETLESISSKVERGGAVIVWEDTEPVGTALYNFVDDYMYIGRVAVLPKHRGKGIGKVIMAHLEQLALHKGYNKTRLGVRLSLPDNLMFYQKLHYISIEEHEYPDKTDKWHIMVKELKDKAEKEIS